MKFFRLFRTSNTHSDYYVSDCRNPSLTYQSAKSSVIALTRKSNEITLTTTMKKKRKIRLPFHFMRKKRVRNHENLLNEAKTYVTSCINRRDRNHTHQESTELSGLTCIQQLPGGALNKLSFFRQKKNTLYDFILTTEPELSKNIESTSDNQNQPEAEQLLATEDKRNNSELTSEDFRNIFHPFLVYTSNVVERNDTFKQCYQDLFQHVAENCNVNKVYNSAQSSNQNSGGIFVLRPEREMMGEDYGVNEQIRRLERVGECEGPHVGCYVSLPPSRFESNGNSEIKLSNDGICPEEWDICHCKPCRNCNCDEIEDMPYHAKIRLAFEDVMAYMKTCSFCQAMIDVLKAIFAPRINKRQFPEGKYAHSLVAQSQYQCPVSKRRSNQCTCSLCLKSTYYAQDVNGRRVRFTRSCCRRKAQSEPSITYLESEVMPEPSVIYYEPSVGAQTSITNFARYIGAQTSTTDIDTQQNLEEPPEETILDLSSFRKKLPEGNRKSLVIDKVISTRAIGPDKRGIEVKKVRIEKKLEQIPGDGDSKGMRKSNRVIFEDTQTLPPPGAPRSEYSAGKKKKYAIQDIQINRHPELNVAPGRITKFEKGLSDGKSRRSLAEEKGLLQDSAGKVAKVKTLIFEKDQYPALAQGKKIGKSKQVTFLEDRPNAKPKAFSYAETKTEREPMEKYYFEDGKENRIKVKEPYFVEDRAEEMKDKTSEEEPKKVHFVSDIVEKKKKRKRRRRSSKTYFELSGGRTFSDVMHPSIESLESETELYSLVYLCDESTQYASNDFMDSSIKNVADAYLQTDFAPNNQTKAITNRSNSIIQNSQSSFGHQEYEEGMHANESEHQSVKTENRVLSSEKHEDSYIPSAENIYVLYSSTSFKGETYCNPFKNAEHVSHKCIQTGDNQADADKMNCGGVKQNKQNQKMRSHFETHKEDIGNNSATPSIHNSVTNQSKNKINFETTSNSEINLEQTHERITSSYTTERYASKMVQTDNYDKNNRKLSNEHIEYCKCCMCSQNKEQNIFPCRLNEKVQDWDNKYLPSNNCSNENMDKTSRYFQSQQTCYLNNQASDEDICYCMLRNGNRYKTNNTNDSNKDVTCLRYDYDNSNDADFQTLDIPGTSYSLKDKYSMPYNMKVGGYRSRTNDSCLLLKDSNGYDRECVSREHKNRESLRKNKSCMTDKDNCNLSDTSSEELKEDTCQPVSSVNENYWVQFVTLDNHPAKFILRKIFENCFKRKGKASIVPNLKKGHLPNYDAMPCFVKNSANCFPSGRLPTAASHTPLVHPMPNTGSSNQTNNLFNKRLSDLQSKKLHACISKNCQMSASANKLLPVSSRIHQRERTTRNKNLTPSFKNTNGWRKKGKYKGCRMHVLQDKATSTNSLVEMFKDSTKRKSNMCDNDKMRSSSQNKTCGCTHSVGRFGTIKTRRRCDSIFAHKNSDFKHNTVVTMNEHRNKMGKLQHGNIPQQKSKLKQMNKISPGSTCGFGFEGRNREVNNKISSQCHYLPNTRKENNVHCSSKRPALTKCRNNTNHLEHTSKFYFEENKRNRYHREHMDCKTCSTQHGQSRSELHFKPKRLVHNHVFREQDQLFNIKNKRTQMAGQPKTKKHVSDKYDLDVKGQHISVSNRSIRNFSKTGNLHRSCSNRLDEDCVVGFIVFHKKHCTEGCKKAESCCQGSKFVQSIKKKIKQK